MAKIITLDKLNDDMQARADKVVQAINRDIPVLVGEMLVDGFRKSFDMQRFNDNGSAKWQEVERRKMGSEWYGFNYRSDYNVNPGSRGYRKSGRPRQYGTQGGITNYTPTATTRSILLGWGSANLRDSIYLHTARRGMVIIASDQPHAEVHNEGMEAKIFGRKTFTMPKRQFMGHSQKLDNEAKKLMETVFTKILS